MARLYREAPLNAIWEGSGNVMCLDVLRALGRDGKAAQEVMADLVRTTTHLPGAAEAASFVESTLRSPEAEANARGAVERLAQLAATAALNEWAPAIAESFAHARLSQPISGTYGTARLAGADVERLLDRALPAS